MPRISGQRGKPILVCLTTSNVFTISTGDTAPQGIEARMPLSRNTCAGVHKLVSTIGGEDQVDKGSRADRQILRY